MAELGERLREVRRRQGLELAQVEAALKVKSKYLRALEWERFDLLPDGETAKRMLRAYAESLHIDSPTPKSSPRTHRGLAPCWA
jgi:cytoskeletal protein RodZ